MRQVKGSATSGGHLSFVSLPSSLLTQPVRRRSKPERKQHDNRAPVVNNVVLEPPTRMMEVQVSPEQQQLELQQHIDARLHNRFMQHLFRSKMAAAVGGDVSSTG